MSSLFLILFLFITPAQTHEWYSSYCCNKKDCHEIVSCSEITETAKGFEWNGYFFDKAMERPSQNGKCHVCLLSGRVPRCIYTVKSF